MRFQEDPAIEPPQPWWRKLLDFFQSHAVIVIIAALVLICLYGAMLNSM
jgi:hypothetical protein